MPLGPGAPAPVRFAQAEIPADEQGGDGEATTRLAMAEAPMVSPLTGRPVERAASQQADDGIFIEAFSDILSEAAAVGTSQARNLDARALSGGSNNGRNYLSAEGSE